MGYGKRNPKGGFKKKTADYMDDASFNYKGHPEDEGKVEFGIAVKAGRNLPKSTYSVQADPYTAALAGSANYPLINALNKRVGGDYAGVANLDGGNVQQYGNSIKSKFLKVFDYLRMKIDINYRFRGARLAALPNTEGADEPYLTSGLIDQCRNAVAEATSQLQATTFTNMAIYNYAIETDMPMGSAIRKEVNFGTEETPDIHYLYTNLNDVLYGTLNYYQIFLQESLNVVNYHNGFRLKMGMMIRNAWNREQPTLNGMFGLFKKKSFLSLIDSICLSFPGEYIDTDWATTVNMLNIVPSRRTNSLNDPVKELQVNHAYPSVFKMYYKSGDKWVLIYDDHQATPTQDSEMGSTWKKVLVGTEYTYMHYWTAIREIMDALNAQDTACWARNNMTIAAGDNARFNYVKTRIDVVNLCLNTFKTLFNDVREVLDVLKRVNLVSWVKGFRPSITKDTDAGQFDNGIVNDIFKMTFGGAAEVKFNPSTKRWESFSVWNLYNGIPGYDSMNGGAFLTLSCKKIDVESDEDETNSYLPIAFFVNGKTSNLTAEWTPVAKATSRDGVEVEINCDEVVMDEEVALKRLVPLPSQSGLKIRVPRYSLTERETNPDNLSDVHQSFLIKMLTHEFGTCSYQLGEGESEELPPVVITVEPDNMAIYQIELVDITNDAIAYARDTAPLKGSTSSYQTLGFAKLGQK